MAATPRKTTLLAALILTALATLALSIAASPAAASQCRNADRLPSALNKTQAAHRVLCLINVERAHHHMSPLRFENAQRKAAVKHTKVMVRERCFAHQCSGEADLVKRISQTAYLPCNCYWGVGENVGYGEETLGTPRAMVEAWMNSPEHRANILNPRYEHIGIGVMWGTPDKPGERGAVTYTTDFGYRR